MGDATTREATTVAGGDNARVEHAHRIHGTAAGGWTSPCARHTGWQRGRSWYRRDGHSERDAGGQCPNPAWRRPRHDRRRRSPNAAWRCSGYDWRCRSPNPAWAMSRARLGWKSAGRVPMSRPRRGARRVRGPSSYPSAPGRLLGLNGKRQGAHPSREVGRRRRRSMSGTVRRRSGEVQAKLRGVSLAEPPSLNHRPSQLRASRQLALHDRPVLPPRRRENVAPDEMAPEPRELPSASAIGRGRHGAEDTPAGASVYVQERDTVSDGKVDVLFHGRQVRDERHTLGRSRRASAPTAYRSARNPRAAESGGEGAGTRARARA